MVDHLIEVTTVRHLGGYRLRLGFSDGAVKDVDLTGTLWGPLFEPLKDPGYFAQVRIDEESGTVCWPNGADLAPDALYELGTTVREADTRAA